MFEGQWGEYAFRYWGLKDQRGNHKAEFHCITAQEITSLLFSLKQSVDRQISSHPRASLGKIPVRTTS